MKHLLSFFLAAILTVSFSLEGKTQIELSSEGTRFWIGFMENITLQFNGEPKFALRISSDIPTTGNIIVPTTNLTIPFEVDAGATEIELPDAIWYSEFAQIIDNKGILIETATPIELAAIHYRIYFTDGAKILPEDALRDAYTVLAVEDFYGVSPSTFVVIATEDNTEIEIIPSSLTEALFPADIPFTITMNAGQSYQVHAGMDLSGSTVRSLNGEKIAVFAGAQQAAVGCAPDDSHMWEQVIPTELWGSEYALVPYRDQSANIFKILASEDNTTLFINCALEATLNAGETYEILSSEPLIITSDVAVQVGHLNRGSSCNPDSQGPSFAILHPLNHHSTGQSINFTGGISGNELTDHYINLVCSDETADQVLLDGNQVTFQSFPDNEGLSYARIALNEGEHSFVAPEGVWAQGYSFGEFEACTYTYGHSILVDPTEEVALSAMPEPSTNLYCAGIDILFQYTSDLTLETISWDFAGLGTSSEDAPTFQFTETGSYEVSFIGTTSNGCQISSSIVIDVVDCTNSIATAIEDQISILQRDGSTVVQSSVSSPLNCTLYGLDGREISHSSGQGTLRLMHNGIAEGVYVLQIWNDKTSFTQKLWITE